MLSSAPTYLPTSPPHLPTTPPTYLLTTPPLQGGTRKENQQKTPDAQGLGVGAKRPKGRGGEPAPPPRRPEVLLKNKPYLVGGAGGKAHRIIERGPGERQQQNLFLLFFKRAKSVSSGRQ